MAKVVTIHVLYKVKRCDEASLTLKARIALHGNKDREKNSIENRLSDLSCSWY